MRINSLTILTKETKNCNGKEVKKENKLTGKNALGYNIL